MHRPTLWECRRAGRGERVLGTGLPLLTPPLSGGMGPVPLGSCADVLLYLHEAIHIMHNTKFPVP